MSKTAVVLLALCVALVTAGVAAIYVPAAAILLGVGCGALGFGSWRSERLAAAPKAPTG